MRRLFFKFLIILLFSFFIIGFSTVSQAENKTKSDHNLEITPNDFLFNVTNMKPGDWAPRTIVVRNIGETDFNYQMSLEQTGNDKLFNELLMEITSIDHMLYEGKLHQFNEISSRTLETLTEEELFVTIRMPNTLGNEYQGLDTSFSFIFTAEIEGSQNEVIIVEGNLGSDGTPGFKDALPKTATLIFNYLLVGFSLVIIGGILYGYHRRKDVRFY